ncbi:hypothetical protein GGQ84_000549 [Desulfitispora alkaliphila]|uniref:hypothetical protein n=1 Tax=Desulfitispora alkaliphila TaxID=622674 RepID=UPI003D22931C
MKDQEQVKKEMEQQLERVKYRIKILDLIEEKIFEMRELAQKVVDGDLTDEETESINQRVKNLEQQVRLLDVEKRDELES